MNTQAKIGIEKREHPERFCAHPRCLWRVMKLNHETQQHELDPRYPSQRCPRHSAIIFRKVLIDDEYIGVGE